MLQDWDEALPFVSVPTLLIAARDDKTKPFEDTRETLEALRVPTRSLCPIEAGGHFSLFDTPLPDGPKGQLPSAHPEEVRRTSKVIADFVRTALA